MADNMRELNVVAVGDSIPAEFAQLFKMQLDSAGMTSGTVLIESAEGAECLRMLWVEEGVIPVAMKICDPKGDAVLTRKAAEAFVNRWRRMVRL